MNISIHTDWKLVPRLESGEALILVESDVRLGTNVLCGVSLAQGLSCVLPIDMAILNVTPVISPQMDELLFAGLAGVYSINFASSKIRELLQIDNERFETCNLWCRPGATHETIYLLGEREAPLSKMIEQARSTGRGVPVKMKYGLYRLQDGQREGKLIHELSGRPLSVVVDWKRDSLVARVDKKGQVELTRIHLRTGHSVPMPTVKGCKEISVLSDGTLLLFVNDNPQEVWRVIRGRPRKWIDVPGEHAAISSDGERIAFMRGDREIWLFESSAMYPQRILSVPAEIAHHRIDLPTWCGCGKHFCVLFADPNSGGETQALAIVDCERRSLVVRNNLSTVRARRLWVAGSLVERFLVDMKNARGE